MKEPLHGTRFLYAETSHERLPLSEAEVAFVGRSNVGKSSLLCALTNNWKLARVSNTPGATRAINVYEARPGRWIIDLPGYGYAVGPVRARNYWPEMIGRTLTGRPMLNRAYVLIDAKVGVGKLDVSLIEWMKENNVPFRLVGTKIDQVGRQKHEALRKKMAAELGVTLENVLWVSAKEGYGMKVIQEDVIKELGLREN